MGLVRDALEAIIRIDKNLALLAKTQGVIPADTDRLTKYSRKLAEQEGSTFYRVTHERDFCYPNNLTLGGRLRAIRLYAGLTQAEFAKKIGVTAPHITNLEADKSYPSAMLIRAVSWGWNIDEHWLATGKLGTGDPADQASETIKQCFQRTMKEFEPEPPIKPTFSRSISGGVNLRLDSESGRDYSRSAEGEPFGEQDLCDSIVRSLRSAGEEAGSDRQGKAHCSRYPSRCTQGSSDKQTS